MQKIDIPGGVLEIRGLKRKELKKLRKYGYKNTSFSPAEDVDLDEAIDKILELVLTKTELDLLDDAEPRHANEAWLAIIKETYGDPAAEKNS